MNTSVNRLSQEALALPLQDRALLATRILESMDDSGSIDVEQAWYDIAEVRLREVEDGTVQTIREDEVRHRVRARIK